MPSSLRAPSSSRNRLLDTSAHLFWSRGYRATTTRQIASVLGLQQASLYHHVTSKEDLLCEICGTAVDNLLAVADRTSADSADPMTRLTNLLRASWATQLEHQKTHATLAFELRSVTEPRRGELKAALQRYRRRLTEAVSSAQTAGDLRQDVAAHHMALSMWNLMTWALLWYRPDGEDAPAVVIERIIDCWLHGVAEDRPGAFSATAGRHDAGAAAPHADATAEPNSVKTADRVLDVAAALFRTKGYDAATAREIAGLLGIQKASLYHHTRGKSRLLLGVCTESLRRIRQDAADAVAAADGPLDRVQRLVTGHVTSLLRHPDHHATSLLELRSLDGHDRASVVALREAHEQYVRSVIEEAQQTGLLRRDVSTSFLTLYLFSLTNRSMLWYRRDGELSPEQLGTLFATLFLAGASAPSAPS